MDCRACRLSSGFWIPQELIWPCWETDRYDRVLIDASSRQVGPIATCSTCEHAKQHAPQRCKTMPGGTDYKTQECKHMHKNTTCICVLLVFACLGFAICLSGNRFASLGCICFAFWSFCRRPDLSGTMLTLQGGFCRLKLRHRNTDPQGRENRKAGREPKNNDQSRENPQKLRDIAPT